MPRRPMLVGLGILLGAASLGLSACSSKPATKVAASQGSPSVTPVADTVYFGGDTLTMAGNEPRYLGR